MCIFQGCERHKYCKDLCRTHYKQLQRGSTLSPIRTNRNFNNGNGWVGKDGYVIVNRNGRKTGQHRVVMMDHLKRDLFPGETVHHKNGVRSDNRIENLELWSTSQPPGQRVEDKLEWAKHLINLYQPIESFDEEELW